MKDRIEKFIKLSGPTFTVQYLKEATRITQKFISGEVQVKSEGVAVSIVNGLPNIIPGPLRMKIRDGDPVTIRAVLTLLSLYKLLKCRPKLKLNTITDPFSGINKVLNPIRVKQVAELLPKVYHYPTGKWVFGKKGYCHTIVSCNAGPNAKKAFLSLPLDALALSRKPRILLALKTLADNFGGKEIFASLKDEISLVSSLYTNIEPKLGKLSFLKEPAGKVRVVAIIDGWTQMLLSGLHDQLQSILEKIPQDGTMDQGRPIDLLPKKEGPVYSFDLSAATDRLPIDLQCQVIQHLFNEDVAWAWREVLVGRAYHAVDQSFKINTSLKYSVGQPMGALSSFNMLALSHHFIVQVASLNCGRTGWFSDYALLGDDIVIADEVVAMAYKTIMLDLGMELSPSKGLQSPRGVFEFCKRLIGPNHEYSPLGMRGLSVALKSPVYLTSLFVDLMGKGFELTSDALEQLFSNPPRFVIKTERIRDNVLWTLLGVFGLCTQSTQIGPGRTLDSSASRESILNFLTLLNATSRVIAKKDISTTQKDSYQFLEKLEKEYSDVAVRHFHGSYILSYIPNTGIMNALVKLCFGESVKLQLSWKNFPSYALIKEHVERSILSSMLEAENFSLVDQFYQTKFEWGNEQELLAVMRKAANGSHSLVNPILDFVKDTTPPLLRVGRRVNDFWREFKRIEKLPYYVNLTSYQCWHDYKLPWNAARKGVRKGS